MKRSRIRRASFAIVSAIFASLFSFSSASALKLSELTPSYDSDAKIEFNAAAEEYDFDVNFLANNQTLQYSAKVRNDNGKDIKVTDITLKSPEHDFFEYDYSGIEIGDTLKSGDEQEIILSINTNSQPTRTSEEDFVLSLKYDEIEPANPGDDPGGNGGGEHTPTNPPTNDNIFIIGAAIVISAAGAVVVVRKNGRRRMFVFLLALPIAALFVSASSTSAAEGLSFEIKGKVNFTNIYTLTGEVTTQSLSMVV